MEQLGTESDLEYFRDKVANATTDEQRLKAQKQLELIEDAVAIYRLNLPERE